MASKDIYAKAIFRDVLAHKDMAELHRRFPDTFQSNCCAYNSFLFKQTKHKTMGGFIKDIADRALVLTEFNEKLRTAVVDRVTVGVDGNLMFRFKDGSENEA